MALTPTYPNEYKGRQPKPPAYSSVRSIFRGKRGAPRKDTQAVLKNVKRTIIP